MRMLLKIKICLVLAVIAAGGLAAYKTGLYESVVSMAGNWSMPERGAIMSDLTAMKEINRLYTGFYMVPIMDISYGDLKGEMLKFIVTGSEPSRTVPKGYCLKKYDTGFGYDNILDLLQDETFMDRVCSGDPSALPTPRLLSINSKATEINGDYQGNCRDWDLERSQQLRRALVYRELNQGEALRKINEHAQKSLHSMASLLCQ